MPKPSKSPDGEENASNVNVGNAANLSSVVGTLSTTPEPKAALDEREDLISTKRKAFGPDISTEQSDISALSDSTDEAVAPTDPIDPD